MLSQEVAFKMIDYIFFPPPPTLPSPFPHLASTPASSPSSFMASSSLMSTSNSNSTSGRCSNVTNERMKGAPQLMQKSPYGGNRWGGVRVHGARRQHSRG